jgi:hypothetical protein
VLYVPGAAVEWVVNVRVADHAVHRLRERARGLVLDAAERLRGAIVDAFARGTARAYLRDAVGAPLRLGNRILFAVAVPDARQPHPRQLVVVTALTAEQFVARSSRLTLPMDGRAAAAELEARAANLDGLPAERLRRMAGVLRGGR